MSPQTPARPLSPPAWWILPALSLSLSPVASAQAGPEASTAGVAPSEELPSEEPPSEEPSSEEPPPGEVVIISASRVPQSLDQATVPALVITRDQILASGARDVAELVESLPGVRISTTVRGDALRLQGLDSEHTLVLIDGERVPGRMEGVMDLSRLPVDNLERVEIVRGPSSSLYGADALAGTVNLVTRQASEPVRVEGEATYGSRNSLDLWSSLGLAGDRLDNQATVGFDSTDGYDLTPEDEAFTGNQSVAFDVSDRATWRPSEDVRLGIKGWATHRQQDRIDAGHSTDYDATKLTSEVSLGVDGSFLAASQGPLAGGVFTPRLRYSWFDDSFVQVPQDGGEPSETWTQEGLLEAGLQYSQPMFGFSSLTTGLEVLLEHMNSERIAGEQADRQRLAWYLEDELVPVDRFVRVAVVPSGRLDLDSMNNAVATPRISGRLDLGPAFALRASVGLGYRAPEFKELLLDFEHAAAAYRIQGNPDLLPEQSRGVNVGVELTPSDALSLDLNLFRNDVENLIVTSMVGVADDGFLVFQYENVAEAYSQGLESSLTLRPLTGLLLGAGYEYLDARDKETDLVLEDRATHRGSARVGVDIKRIGLSLHGKGELVGPRNFYEDLDGDGEDEAVVADPFARVDVRLSQEVGERLALLAGVDNAADVGDEDYNRMEPRRFYGGARMQW